MRFLNSVMIAAAMLAVAVIGAALLLRPSDHSPGLNSQAIEARAAPVSCGDLEANLLAEIETARECRQDSECTFQHLGCPFGCYTAFNSKALPSITAKVQYFDSSTCKTCQYVCRKLSGRALCVAGQCTFVAVPERPNKSLNTDARDAGAG